MLFCFVVTLVSILGIWVLAKLFLPDKRLVGEFVQVCYRSSAAILGTAFLQSIYGTAEMSSMMILGSVPLYNVMAVVILMLEGPEAAQAGSMTAKLKKSVKGILTNPTLLGIAAGFAGVTLGDGLLWRVLQFIVFEQPICDKVLALEDKYAAMSESELKNQTTILKERLANGETTDDILPEAFATCREAGWRVLGMKHFPVQIIGGIVLHQGRIAEMKTGEGKTLVATLPAYLNALTGEGVHIVTVNDYLARRDSEWMGKLYRYLGLSVVILRKYGS